MENSAEAEDDQGSGWLQVKKKHRTSSKFSLHSWVGKSKGKHKPDIVAPMYNKTRSLHGKRDPYYSNSGPELDKNRNESSTNTATIKDVGGTHYQDKCVVNQDNKCCKAPHVITGAATSNRTTVDKVEISQTARLDVFHKLKWGDIEDGTLSLNCENSVGVESHFGSPGNRSAVSEKSENHGAGLCNISCSEPKNTLVLKSSLNASIGHDHEMHICSCKDECSEDNNKEVIAISSEEFKIHPECRKIVNSSGNPSTFIVCHENLEMSNDDLLDGDPPLEKAEPHIVPELGECRAPEQLAPKRGSRSVSIDQESELHPDNSGASTTMNSIEDSRHLHDGAFHDELSKTQIMTGMGEGDTRESKERFRERLWCFLFENLNRAVDELYLLCELECDLEQMKEAVLVLEEAASDFRDLNSRVEEFENMKKSSSEGIDEQPATLKSDQRRPHALSWEVRRMTTSPHRAEILSSSLEAFKKIQHGRASICAAKDMRISSLDCSKDHTKLSGDLVKKSARRNSLGTNCKDLTNKFRKQGGSSDLMNANTNGDKRSSESSRSSRILQNSRLPFQNSSSSDTSSARPAAKDNCAVFSGGKNKKELVGFTSETEKLPLNRGGTLAESIDEKKYKCLDHTKRQSPLSDKDKDKEMRNSTSWKSMDAWKEKRNWGDILASPFRVSSRASYSPGMSRRSAERARVLHDKLMSPEKKKKTSLDVKKDADEKHARAMRIRSELENERVQKLQRTSEKLNRVNEWQAVRSLKMREGMYARHQRSESRHEAHLAQVVRRAGDESSKVNEVRFITSLNEENKKLILRQKLHDSELRRAEKLQVLKTKQKEDMAREEAALERRRLIEAEKLHRLAEIQRKKEEALVRREEERRASSAAREAKAIEQLRRKQARAKAQQEEAEILAQKLAERLRESEQRRKFYLEQIRERASMDFRDQCSPLLRHSLGKENQVRSTAANNVEDIQVGNPLGVSSSTFTTSNLSMQHPLKRRIKKIRQRLMALKHEYLELPIGAENGGVGYRSALGTARAKIAKWIQELQRLRQARKEGAANIGQITAEMVKFVEGKEPELHASRQAGLLDFIASALPASHTSKPEACQVTVYLLRLLRVVLSLPANRIYFLAQNLLPPIIPMLSAALENYIKIAASLNASVGTNEMPSKTLENFESMSEILEGFLWAVAAIIGHISSDEREIHMQDSLLELVVVYQVVHHLRDLFALYDRPQVEGSPFPTSILLSIKLLTVLTSISGNLSSINWESCPTEIAGVTGIEEVNSEELTDSGGLSLDNANQDPKTSLSVLESCGVSIFGEVPDGGQSNAFSKEYMNDKSALIEKKLEDVSSTVIMLDDCKIDLAGASSEMENKTVEDIDKPVGVKDEKNVKVIGATMKHENLNLKHSTGLLLSAVSETGLVCLPSLLTAVLLQANNRLPSEQGSYVLPSNFEEVATGVLKILNNVALVDITLVQRMLATPDLKMEFFHLMSFLLSHCTSKWARATDQIGLLLLESLLLLGYFSLFHPGNQAVLRWGKSPTILHKVCDLPFVFFSDPELMPILASTLIAACYHCEQNKGVIQQEISIDMLLQLLKSCRNVMPTVTSNASAENPTDDSGECNTMVPESRRLLADMPLKSSRAISKANRIAMVKSGALGNYSRAGKARTQRDNKPPKVFEDKAGRDNSPSSDISSMLLLHSRFPPSFVDKAEQFFSSGVSSPSEA